MFLVTNENMGLCLYILIGLPSNLKYIISFFYLHLARKNYETISHIRAQLIRNILPFIPSQGGKVAHWYVISLRIWRSPVQTQIKAKLIIESNYILFDCNKRFVAQKLIILFYHTENKLPVHLIYNTCNCTIFSSIILTSK